MNSTSPIPPQFKVRRAVWVLLFIAVLCLSLSFIAYVVFTSVQPMKNETDQNITPASTETPTFSIETVATGLDHPWDVAFLPDGQLIVAERNGKISILREGVVKEIASVGDVKAAGEGGLMGMAVDPNAGANHFIYTCYSTISDIRVVRWRVADDSLSLSDKLPIVTGIFAGTGNRHQGCRIAFSPDGYLWIGTGDAAQPGQTPQTPQNPKSLAGKILRVDRDGKAAPDNLPEPFDSRVYSYGHRNIQGIAFLARPLGDIVGFSAEHGSTVDDEINVLKKGNFGWDPDAAYTEKGIPMTNKQKYPDAIDATWSSGNVTQAPSGLAILKGERWKGWNGALAIAILKDQHVRILRLNDKGAVTGEERIVSNKGRIRDVEQAPSGALYITTDNGGKKDEIIRLTPN